MMLILIFNAKGATKPLTRERTSEYIDDATITTKVKAATFNDPMLKVLQIKAETYKGVVLLSGFVDKRQMAAHATEVTQK